MQLNMDCVRDVLLYLEKNLDVNKAIYVSSINLDQYTQDDILYSALKLGEAGYLNIKAIPSFTNIECQISSITWDGHHFLDTIRPETVWNKTKSVASELGTMTLNGIFQIGSQIVSQMIYHSLGM